MKPSGNRIINATFLGSYDKWPPKDLSSLPQICFSGRSNVGKSSLINALVGQRSLARTSSTPGRTQQLVLFRAEMRSSADTVPFNIVDLPGYGYAKVPLAVKDKWRPMMERYFQGNELLRCCVFITDLGRKPGNHDRELLEMMGENGVTVLPVATKIDKVPKTQRVREMKVLAEHLGFGDWRDMRPVSAKEGTGIVELLVDLGEVLGV